MSVRSRVAFATGVAGLVGATLLLTGRFDGSAALAILFAWGARLATDASLADTGPILAADAVRRLRQQATFAPAWALIVAAGTVRAGSSALADVRGANRVAGLALAHGPSLSVAGAWCALAGGALALVLREPIGVETASSAGSAARIVPPVALRRLEAASILALAALLATLFFGPQISSVSESLWWVAGIGALTALAWLGRGARPRNPGLLAGGLAGAGLALVLIGGTV